MAIRVLDQHVAELIAAGEVVERPASVVKELLENAIDAGAAKVVVSIERGGVSLIRIEDDGGGIPAEDIPLAFVRHATSKIATQDDLDAINTLGFRGEALASIASVSSVELLTKTDEDEYAHLYTIAGGAGQGVEPAARGRGTTIAVKDLFYNTPARMKFLKKDVTEGGYVTEVVTRLALSHPEIAFQYNRDGKPVFITPGDGSLRSAVWAVLGAGFSKELVEVSHFHTPYAVTGIVTRPHASRASRSMQFFFINGRFVKNRTMMAALEQAYRGMMMQGKFPGGVLFLAMPPELVDVNVHPAKTEVRFAGEKDVFETVYRGVKNAVTEDSRVNHPQFELKNEPAAKSDAPQPAVSENQNTNLRDTQTGIPVSISLGSSSNSAEKLSQNTNRDTVGSPQNATQIKHYNNMVETLASDAVFAPYETRGARAGRELALSIEPGPEEQTLHNFGRFTNKQTDCPEVGAIPAAIAAPATEQIQNPGASEGAMPRAPVPAAQTGLWEQEEKRISLRFIGEVFKTYILAEYGNTLCLIDKHAGHERILYERLAATKKDTDSQQLLQPVSLALSAGEKAALLENLEALQNSGIEVEDFGGNSVLVRGIPADVEPSSVEDLIEEVARRMSVNNRDTMNEKTEWVMHSIACRTAVKAGDATAPQQLLRLAEDILTGGIPPFCPHGRPVILEITEKELEKQFGRLG